MLAACYLVIVQACKQRSADCEMRKWKWLWQNKQLQTLFSKRGEQIKLRKVILAEADINKYWLTWFSKTFHDRKSSFEVKFRAMQNVDKSHSEPANHANHPFSVVVFTKYSINKASKLQVSRRSYSYVSYLPSLQIVLAQETVLWSDNPKHRSRFQATRV